MSIRMSTRYSAIEDPLTRSRVKKLSTFLGPSACLLVISLLVALSHAEAQDNFKPFKLKTLDGTQKTLADFLNQATLISFFFPSCPYCNAAFPEVQKIYDKYKDKGLSAVWINVVPEENKKIADWQAKRQYTIPVLIGASQASLERGYKLKMTPTHYLLDAEGKVLFHHAGYEKGDEKALEAAIQRALHIGP